MAYMKELHANITQYVGTAPQAIDLVGQPDPGAGAAVLSGEVMLTVRPERVHVIGRP